jgi:hypothetical protein
MMDSSLIGLLVIVGAGMVTGITVIVFASIVTIRKEAHKHEGAKLAHAERLRAIELGQPLPDAEIARANAECSRARAAGTVGTVVPAIALSAAAGISVMILGEPYQGTWHGLHPQAHLLIVIWSAAGIVSLAAVLGSLRTLRRAAPARAVLEPIPLSVRQPEPQATDTKEQIAPK